MKLKNHFYMHRRAKKNAIVWLSSNYNIFDHMLKCCFWYDIIMFENWLQFLQPQNLSKLFTFLSEFTHSVIPILQNLQFSRFSPSKILHFWGFKYFYHTPAGKYEAEKRMYLTEIFFYLTEIFFYFTEINFYLTEI